MPDSTYKLQSGREVKLPLIYKNWKAMTATFTISAKDAEKLLPPKLKPILLAPRTALISFSGFEYPEVSDLASYNEFGITIPVEYEPRLRIPFLPIFFNPLFTQSVYKHGGNYVYYLPVTTEESFHAGSEIWGYPKVPRKIEFQETASTRICILMDEKSGIEEARLEIEKLPIGKNEKNFSFQSYTEKNGNLLLTPIPARGKYGTKMLGGSASIKLGGGEKLEPLRNLKIGKKPVHIFYAEIQESELMYSERNFIA